MHKESPLVRPRVPDTPTPPRFHTWGSVIMNGKKADHEETVKRIKAAGYCYTAREHPETETRGDCYQYELYVVFDIHNLGTYKPA